MISKLQAANEQLTQENSQLKAAYWLHLRVRLIVDFFSLLQMITTLYI
jgi:hypothetical protein